MLGIALTLPMIFLSGPLAGYFVGYFLIQKLGFPGYTSPVLMGLGLLGSGLQAYRLIKQLNNSNKEN